MKKTFLLVLQAIVFSGAVFAQSIPNQGFENWSQFAGEYFLDAWDSGIMYSDSPVVFRSTDNHSGQYSVMMKLGKDAEMWRLQNYVATAQKPKYLNGFFKCALQQGDSLYLGVHVRDTTSFMTYSSVTVTADTFASWTPFYLPIAYTGIPMSLTIEIILAGNGTSKVYFDDFSFSDTPIGNKLGTRGTTGIQANSERPYQHRVIPNPASDNAALHFTAAGAHAIARIFDMSGRELIMLDAESIHEGDVSLPFDTRKLACGVYFYTISAGQETATGRFVITR